MKEKCYSLVWLLPFLYTTVSGSTLLIDNLDTRYQNGFYNLEEYFEVLIDSTNILTIDDILGYPYLNKFAAAPKGFLNKINHQKITYWIRIKITPHLSKVEKWYMGLTFPQLEMYEMNAGKITVKYFGTQDTRTTYVIDKLAAPIIPIMLDTTKTLYFKAQPKNHSSEGQRDITDIHQYLLNQDFITNYSIERRWNTALILGILLTTFLYHFIIYWRNNLPAYLFLSLYIFTYIFLLRWVYMDSI